MFPSDIDFEAKVTLETEANPVSDELPFQVLLIGDWSGRDFNSVPHNSEKQDLVPYEVDRDNFNEILRQFGIKIRLNLADFDNKYITLRFSQLDDFHPDYIYAHNPIFSELQDLRQRLQQHDTFELAAKQVRDWFSEPQNEIKETNTIKVPTDDTSNTSDNLLDRILEQKEENTSESPPQPVESSELNALIAKVVKPFLIKTDEVEQAKLIEIVDEISTDLMKQILQHPRFKHLEAAWRGLNYLVRNVETDARLKLFLLDISKNEINQDLKSVDDLSDSRLYKVLKSENNWSVICGNFYFKLNIEDTATIIRLAKISNFINAPFISALNPEIFGVKSFSTISDNFQWGLSEDNSVKKLWKTIREMPEAAYLGFLIPRILVRLPYGADTEPLEQFSFEEFSKDFDHEDYLWVNPCFACALLLSESFKTSGWSLNHLQQDIVGLPIHMYEKNGVINKKLSTEILFSENVGNFLLDLGMMPLLSNRESDRVRLARFQSAALPSATLHGKWYT